MAEVNIPIKLVNDLPNNSSLDGSFSTLISNPLTGALSKIPLSGLKPFLSVDNGLNIVTNWIPSNTPPSGSPARNDAWVVSQAGSTDIAGGVINAQAGDIFFWDGFAWRYVKYSENNNQLFVGTISEARALTGAMPPMVLTTGFGGGVWAIDATDTTTLDNTGTVIVTPGGTRYKRQFPAGNVFPSWFGAYPFYDKVTMTGVNNSQYIQKAIDYLLLNGGGNCCFEPGDWFANSRIFINTNEQVPITLTGFGINYSYSQTGTLVKGDTFFTQLTGGLFYVGMNNDGSAFYSDDGFLYKSFGVRNMSFKGENALTGIDIFRTYHSRTVMDNVSATHCDWLIYQPDTTTDGKGNYCDGSSYQNVKIYNSRYGGLYLYKCDTCRISDFKFEANTTTTQRGIVMTGASGAKIDGIILGGNATIPDLISGSVFVDIVNCKNTEIRPTHFEHCYFEHCIRIGVGSQNTIITGMYMKFEHYNAITFRGLVESVMINGWYSFGTGPRAGYYDLNAVNTSTDDITISGLNLRDPAQEERDLVKNGSINTTLANKNNLLTKENIILPRSINELVRGFAYTKGAQSLTGGGTVTYDGSGNLKWTDRFFASSVDKINGASGFIQMFMPANGTVIAGIGTTPSVTVTASGIPFNNAWNYLVAEHTTGTLGTTVIYKIGVFGTAGTNTILSNQILIAARNSDTGFVKIGTGQVLQPNGSMIKGVVTAKAIIQRIVNTDATISPGTEVVILNEGLQVNGLNRTLTIPAVSISAGEKIEFYNNNSGSFGFLTSLPLTDKTGTTITTLPNQSVIEIRCDGTVWRVKNIY